MVIYLGWGYVPGGDRAEVGQPCAGSFVSLLPFFLEFMERAWWLGELHEVPIHDESERESNDERNQKKKNREEKSQQQRRRRRRRANNSSAESAR